MGSLTFALFRGWLAELAGSAQIERTLMDTVNVDLRWSKRRPSSARLAPWPLLTMAPIWL
jgi:hypothetical protein